MIFSTSHRSGRVAHKILLLSVPAICPFRIPGLRRNLCRSGPILDKGFDKSFDEGEWETATCADRLERVLVQEVSGAICFSHVSLLRRTWWELLDARLV